jgi:hypothetical protein
MEAAGPNAAAPATVPRKERRVRLLWVSCGM